ncbi:hypothetical protein [Shewanella acanthi]|uniref:hypothetical protein n=1 Tax=Shewanella acanthi TaxID=2864212 RepID=UPI0021AC64AD|nr:hypothetical protein [Shewanella acanthi]
MQYQPGANNNLTGKIRREFTMMLVARFGLVCPSNLAWLYGIKYRMALAHLNKLVDEELLTLVTTHRSLDGRVYVLSYSGAKFAEELLNIAVYFRSKEHPALQVNQNTLMHDLIMQFVMLKGIHNQKASGQPNPLWDAIVTEPEFKRRFTSTDIRNVDGIVREIDGTISAIEMEHSFKTKAARQTILLKWHYGISHGYYDKVMLFSPSQQIFSDIKRLHEALFEEMTTRRDKKTGQSLLTQQEAESLKSKIIYRTLLCNELTERFYR